MSLTLEALAHILETVGELPCSTAFLDNVSRRVVEAEKHADDHTVKYRASSIGKPWLTQVLDKWYGGKRQFYVKNCLAMLSGILAEQALIEILTLCDYGFEEQGQVDIGLVRGHYDMVLTVKGVKIVLECKSMASHVIAGFAASPNDDYGYLSQLAFYWEATRRAYPDYEVEGAFVLFDRSANKFRLVEIARFALEAKVRRFVGAIDKVSALADYDVDGLLALGAIPPTVNGKLPSSMQWSRWAKVFYRCNDSGVWSVQDEKAIALQLKQLPLERSDRDE